MAFKKVTLIRRFFRPRFSLRYAPVALLDAADPHGNQAICLTTCFLYIEPFVLYEPVLIRVGRDLFLQIINVQRVHICIFSDHTT